MTDTITRTSDQRRQRSRSKCATTGLRRTKTATPTALVIWHYDELAPYLRTEYYETQGPPGIDGAGAAEYGPPDKVNKLKAIADMGAVMYPQLQQVDFRTQVPRLDVPVYLVKAHTSSRHVPTPLGSGSTSCRRQPSNGSHSTTQDTLRNLKNSHIPCGARRDRPDAQLNHSRLLVTSPRACLICCDSPVRRPFSRATLAMT
ncbi:MAG TPA: hypothetical protein VFR23_01515 [Jiangellaceae bacterium]|nr:hypothetical protein [Jiangellaceae bacterium]